MVNNPEEKEKTEARNKKAAGGFQFTE